MLAMGYEIPSLVLARFFFAGWRPRPRPWWRFWSRRSKSRLRFVGSGHPSSVSFLHEPLPLNDGEKGMGDLFIVSHRWPDLYETVKGLCEERGTEVILDRRRAERRQPRTPHVPERRRGDRRTAWAARVHLPEPPRPATLTAARSPHSNQGPPDSASPAPQGSPGPRTRPASEAAPAVAAGSPPTPVVAAR